MKVAIVLLSSLALVAPARRYPGRYPGGGSGTPIVFPGQIGGGGGGVIGGGGHVGVGGGGHVGVGGGHIHDQGHGHVKPVRPGGGGGSVGGGGSGIVGGGGFSRFQSAIGHFGEPLDVSQCGLLDIHNFRGDASFQGSAYHFSWCNDGGQRYTWQGALNYCSNLGPGWYPVAVESRAEDNFIIDIVGRHRSPWIWTGGNRLNNNKFVWEWSDGQRVGYTNWGQTGSENRPQPDNAENNDERCLAYLNQFYDGDLITWHDIGCHHEKPTICELPASGQVSGPQYG